MPTLLESCNKYFSTSDLYQAIGLEKGCNEADIKKAYYKQSLKVHPDRVNESQKEEATEKFQTLGKIYSILSDAEKRKIYDETGSVDEEDFNKGDMNWEDYWRLLFKKITKDDIIEFENKYKNSEEEIDDIKNFYEKHEGDMDKIMSSVLCATLDDEPRIREIIQKLIDDGKVQSYNAFTGESKKKQVARKRKAEREAQEAEKAAKDLGLDGNEDSLRALIQKRNHDRGAASENFFSALEAKYGGKSNKKQGASKKKSRAKEEEEDEEEDEEPKLKKSKRNTKTRVPQYQDSDEDDTDDDDDDDDEDYRAKSKAKAKPKKGKTPTKGTRGRPKKAK